MGVLKRPTGAYLWLLKIPNAPKTLGLLQHSEFLVATGRDRVANIVWPTKCRKTATPAQASAAVRPDLRSAQGRYLFRVMGIVEQHRQLDTSVALLREVCRARITRVEVGCGVIGREQHQ